MSKERLDLGDAINTTWVSVWKGTAWGVTACRYAEELRRFTATARDEWTGGLLKDVTTPVLDAWIATHDESPATTNRRLAAISKVFTVARQRGYTGPVPYFPRKKEATHRTRWLTVDEEQTLLRQLILASKGRGDAYFNSDASDIAILLLDTGMRLGEAYQLLMADLNWTTGLITIRESKGGKPRSVPMTRRVQTVLNTRDPKLPLKLGRTEFRKRWEIAREKMGMKDDASFVPHVLRHTCASRMIQRGVHLKVVQEMLGHADIKMTMRYAHLAPENLEAAKVALESYDDG